MTGVVEPIAIVGMACRFAGADSPADFWRRHAPGADLIREGEPGSGIGRVGHPARTRRNGGRRGRSAPISGIWSCVPLLSPHLAGRGADAGPAAAPDAGDELARVGGRGDRSRPAAAAPGGIVSRLRGDAAWSPGPAADGVGGGRRVVPDQPAAGIGQDPLAGRGRAFG